MKKIILLTSFILLNFSLFSSEIKDYTFGNFTYIVENNEAVIIAYTSDYTKHLIIPATINNYKVTAIGDEAFSGSENLLSIEIPDSVTSIGVEAFSWCKNLHTIEIANSVSSISSSAFLRCDNLDTVLISNKHPIYSFIDGVIFNKVKKSLHIYIASNNRTTYKIPYSITSIGNSAFSGSALETVEIPNSVTSIGDYAFFVCENLEAIEIPNSVTSIGDYAFSLCGNLQLLEIPSSVTFIGENAFSYNSYNFILEVEEGTYVHNYARENNIPYTFKADTSWLY